MKQIIIPFILILMFCSCTEYKCDTGAKHQNIEELINNLEDSHNKEIIVVAHRGDWRNAPENSLQAIQNCIDMGVDMVEIDVRLTKDSIPILMHDKTIDRTTNGTGMVNEFTYKELQEYHLVDGLNVKTLHKIPTLEEALELAKGKILVNLDKSYSIFKECYRIIEKTQTQNQVIIKGTKTRQEVENEFGEFLDKVLFMPVVRLPNENANSIVNDYLEHWSPVAIEFTLKHNDSMVYQFGSIRNSGTSVWVNALWPQHNAGHDDEKAVLNPNVYNWFIANKIDIIQTDRPQLLLNYLRKKGYHN